MRWLPVPRRETVFSFIVCALLLHYTLLMIDSCTDSGHSGKVENKRDSEEHGNDDSMFRHKVTYG